MEYISMKFYKNKTHKFSFNKMQLKMSLAGWWQLVLNVLTHWGRVTHICVGDLTIIGLDNGLSPGRRQAIFWTNVGILLIGPVETNFNEILMESLTFSFKKMCLKYRLRNGGHFVSASMC